MDERIFNLQVIPSRWSTIFQSFKSKISLTFPNAKESNQAIRWACTNGKIECVRSLLADPNVDPTEENNEALMLGIK